MTGGEHELWSRISARGWSERPEFTEFLFSFGQVAALSEGCLSFFAELDGEPVATGVLRFIRGLLCLEELAPNPRRATGERSGLYLKLE